MYWKMDALAKLAHTKNGWNKQNLIKPFMVSYGLVLFRNIVTLNVRHIR